MTKKKLSSLEQKAALFVEASEAHDRATKAESALAELRGQYDALRAAINKHMDAHGYPNLKGDEADRALWSVLDRA